MKTREDLIKAFVDLREYIREQRNREDDQKRYKDEELNGMLMAIGYLSACIYPDDCDSFLESINNRIN